MVDDQLVHVGIDLLIDGERISGRIRIGDGPLLEFSGLLELFGIIDRLRDVDVHSL